MDRQLKREQQSLTQYLYLFLLYRTLFLGKVLSLDKVNLLLFLLVLILFLLVLILLLLFLFRVSTNA